MAAVVGFSTNWQVWFIVLISSSDKAKISFFILFIPFFRIRYLSFDIEEDISGFFPRAFSRSPLYQLAREVTTTFATYRDGITVVLVLVATTHIFGSLFQAGA
jgi:hypothetical protein